MHVCFWVSVPKWERWWSQLDSDWSQNHYPSKAIIPLDSTPHANTFTTNKKDTTHISGSSSAAGGMPRTDWWLIVGAGPPSVRQLSSAQPGHSFHPCQLLKWWCITNEVFRGTHSFAVKSPRLHRIKCMRPLLLLCRSSNCSLLDCGNIFPFWKSTSNLEIWALQTWFVAVASVFSKTCLQPLQANNHFKLTRFLYGVWLPGLSTIKLKAPCYSHYGVS